MINIIGIILLALGFYFRMTEEPRINYSKTYEILEAGLKGSVKND